MRLSPLDVQHMDFPSAVSGYQKRQVREFLERVADELEEALRENQALRDDLKKRESRIEELQVAEVELKRAVIAAERIANEIKENARREAELILKQAEQQREVMLHDSEQRLREARSELTRLEREQRLFREQFRGLLRAFERSLESAAEASASLEGS